MLAGPIVGLLVTLGWRYAFLYDLLAAVPLVIMLFFLNEPERESDGEVSAVARTEEKQPLDKRLIAYVVLQFVGTMALYPLLSGMSSYMDANGVGSAFLAGLAVSTYNLAGVLINMALDPLEKALGKLALPVIHLVFSGGMALVVFTANLPGIFAGAAVCGMAFNTLMSIFQLYNGRVGTPAQATLVSSMLIAALGLGNFVSVYYINACHAIFHMASDITSTYFGSMLVYIALAVLCFVLRLAPERTKKN